MYKLGVKQHKPMTKKNQLARIENFLILNGQYNLTAKEQKVILYLISKINPAKESKFCEQTVRIAEMKNLLLGEGNSNSFYEEIVNFGGRIVKKGITFSSDVKFQDKPLPGWINWFQAITPTTDDDGNVCLTFLFSEPLTPFLLQLNEYSRISLSEVLSLSSGFSIRMYQVFRAELNKRQKHTDRSSLDYDLDDLRALIGVESKYPDFRNFRRRVLDVIEKEVTENTTINVEYELRKTGRKVTGVIFNFKNKRPKKSSTNKSSLTFAQEKAVDIFADFGVVEEIASIRIVPKIAQSNEWEGYEDWVAEEMLNIFKKKGKGNAGSFVKWVLKLEIFKQGDHFATIAENIIARKKKLIENNPVAWQNRKEAAKMSAEAFRTSKRKDS
ncbi:MAG: plasmid replication initiation protein [Saprospiraceae bacterium]